MRRTARSTASYPVCGLLAASLWLAIAAAPALAAPSVQDQAGDLVREAGKLINAKQYPEAAAKLEAALKLTPENPDVYEYRGYLNESRGDKEAALADYGHLLYLDAANAYAPARINHLFLTGKFPKSVKLAYLKFAPISTVIDECRMPGADGQPAMAGRFVYTTSMLFPEEMADNGPPVKRDLPALAGREGGNSASFNRVTYGFIVPEGSEIANLAFVLSYPSALLSAKGADYAQLTPRLMHMLLRAYWYNHHYLGRPQQDHPLHVWLCDSGPAGAEQLDDNIYLYDAATPRTALEWTRELMHEYGHWALPPMGKFVEPESFASGEVGERLSLQWLADEAGRVAKAPWPQPGAIAALGNLWGKDELPLQDYLTGKARKPLDLWQAEGPESQLSGGLGADGMSYFVGFMLWIEAAHGSATLKEVLDKAPGNSPGDYVFAYKAAVKALADDKKLTIVGGSLCLKRSKLQATPAEGATRREGVAPAGGEGAAYWVYLPAGRWLAVVSPTPTGAITAVADNGKAGSYVAGKGADLGVVTEGWHCVTIAAPAGAAAQPLGSISFLKAPEV